MHARADGSLPPSTRFIHDDAYSAARFAARMLLGRPAHAGPAPPGARRRPGRPRCRGRRVDPASTARGHRRGAGRARAAAGRRWPPGGHDVRLGRTRPRCRPATHDARPLGGVDAAGPSACASCASTDCSRCASCTSCCTCTGSSSRSPRPVKCLADCLGHEHAAGRVERVRRGWYRAIVDGLPGPSGPGAAARPRRLVPGRRRPPPLGAVNAAGGPPRRPHRPRDDDARARRTGPDDQRQRRAHRSRWSPAPPPARRRRPTAPTRQRRPPRRSEATQHLCGADAPRESMRSTSSWPG